MAAIGNVIAGASEPSTATRTDLGWVFAEMKARRFR